MNDDDRRDLMRLLQMMEEKLIELMGDDAYSEWSKQIGKELFRMSIDDMEESNFKKFCQENFDMITSDEPMSGLYYWEDEDALGSAEDEA